MKAGVVLIALLLISCSQEQPFIVIGALLPLTGDHADDGIAAQQGIELAVKEINQRGILESPLRVVVKDTACDPVKAVAAVQELVLAQGVRSIIGDMCADSTRAAAEVAEQNRVVLFSLADEMGTDETSADDYFFTFEANDSGLGNFAAELMYDLGHRKLALLYNSTDLSTLGETFVSQGGTFTAERVNATIKPQMTRIKVSKPDALFIYGSQQFVDAAVEQATKNGVTAQLFSNRFVNSENFVVIAGDNAVFRELYKRVYDQEAPLVAAHGYAAVKTISDAIRTGKNTGESIKERLQTLGIGEITEYEVLVVKEGRLVPMRE